MKIFGINIRKEYCLLHKYSDVWWYGDPVSKKKDLIPQIEYQKRKQAITKIRTRWTMEYEHE